mmetsp:Transcript_5567/g.34514  ORF Transcript_5567/g.34514 Transcript_5567/m.34514 type:complete len:321 (+) Transcript_5567:1161-2123(+)
MPCVCARPPCFSILPPPVPVLARARFAPIRARTGTIPARLGARSTLVRVWQAPSRWPRLSDGGGWRRPTSSGALERRGPLDSSLPVSPSTCFSSSSFLHHLCFRFRKTYARIRRGTDRVLSTPSWRTSARSFPRSSPLLPWLLAPHAAASAWRWIPARVSRLVRRPALARPCSAPAVLFLLHPHLFCAPSISLHRAVRPRACATRPRTRRDSPRLHLLHVLPRPSLSSHFRSCIARGTSASWWRRSRSRARAREQAIPRRPWRRHRRACTSSTCHSFRPASHPTTSWSRATSRTTWTTPERLRQAWCWPARAAGGRPRAG